MAKLYIPPKPFTSEDDAYEYLREVLFPKVSEHVRLYKTPQSLQDAYIVIRPISAAVDALFTPSVFRIDRDINDMLMSVGIPPHVLFIGETLQGKPHLEKLTLLPAWRREQSVQEGRLSGLCYVPGGDLIIDGKLNTFRDVSVPSIPPPSADSLEDLLHHIRENICNGRAEYADYLLDWLAHMLQKPAHRPKTAIAVIGGQGTGKGILMDFLKLMLGGDRNCNTTASATDTKAFNAALAQKLFVVFDEATFAGDRQQSDFMKKFVTEKTIRIEQKGVDAFEIENFVRVLITSNNMNSAVPVGIGGRRWLIMECRNDVDTAWLKRLATTIGNNGPIEGAVENYASWFKHFLMTRDLTGFDPIALPMQDTGFETKLMVLYKEDPVRAFFWEWLMADDLILKRQMREMYDGEMQEFEQPMKWEREVQFSIFYAILAEHCKASFATLPAANRIRGLLQPFGATTTGRNGNVTYVLMPHPKDCLAELRKASRFDNPISDAQLQIIASAVDYAEKPPRLKTSIEKFFELPDSTPDAEILIDGFGLPTEESK